MEDATSLCHLLTCALVSRVKNVQPETYSQDSLASMVKAFESKGLHLWMTHVDETWVTWVTWVHVWSEDLVQQSRLTKIT